MRRRLQGIAVIVSDYVDGLDSYPVEKASRGGLRGAVLEPGSSKR